jgi:hypothetical protein
MIDFFIVSLLLPCYDLHLCVLSHVICYIHVTMVSFMIFTVQT